MKKMENQKLNKGLIYTESKTARDETINTVEYDFLDKMKAIVYLTDDMVLSLDQVANYYESTKKSVDTIITRNKEEFLDEITVLRGQDLIDFKEKVSLLHVEGDMISNKAPSLTLVTKRALLRIGMIMTGNAMATRVRNYLLNLEEDAKFDRKQWAIQREVGIVERKRMTSAIAKYVPNTKHKQFAYPTYTNMLYRILFGKEAKELKEERNVKTNDALRDTFTEKELHLVEEGETIITALLTLNFTYKQIEEHLKNKYIKQISKK
jgi:hypothetical protein